MLYTRGVPVRSRKHRSWEVSAGCDVWEQRHAGGAEQGAQLLRDAVHTQGGHGVPQGTWACMPRTTDVLNKPTSFVKDS